MQLSNMMPGVNIIGRKFLGSKEHLNWFKIDWNAAKIITIQDYKHAQD